jgi:hypothetical protein
MGMSDQRGSSWVAPMTLRGSGGREKGEEDIQTRQGAMKGRESAMRKAGEKFKDEVGRGGIEEAGRDGKRDASSDSGPQETFGCRQHDAQGRGAC